MDQRVRDTAARELHTAFEDLGDEILEGCVRNRMVRDSYREFQFLIRKLYVQPC